VPPGQLPAPLLTGQAVRNGHIAGLVRRQEGGERVRPAEGSVDARLVRGRQHGQDSFVVSTHAEILDNRLAVIPVKHRHSRPDWFGG
jgi:hypothetical protein